SISTLRARLLVRGAAHHRNSQPQAARFPPSDSDLVLRSRMSFRASCCRAALAAAVCAAALRPIPAAAQQQIDEARKNARLHMAGLYVTPTFQIKEFGLDTNVFNQSGEATPDFVTTLSPGADLAFPIAHRALLTSHVDADLVYFAHYATERSINPNVSLRASGFFHRLTLFADGNYLNSRQRLNQEIDARARRTDKSV